MSLPCAQRCWPSPQPGSFPRKKGAQGVEDDKHVDCLLSERSSLEDGTRDDRDALFLGQSWTWNGLDDLLNPRKGWLAKLQVGGASQALLSTESFGRLYGKANYLYPFNRRWSLGLRAEAGLVVANSRFTAAHLPPRDPAMLAAVAAVADRIKAARLGIIQDNRVVMLNRDPVALAVTGDGTGFVVDVGGRHLAIETDWSPGEPLMHATVDRQVIVVQIDAVGSGWRLIHEGGQAEALVLTPRQAELYGLMPVKAARDTSNFLLSPMPGLLASVAVNEGQEIKTGEVLAVVEAMKMENVLRATRDGTVKTLHAKAGDSLRVDQKIIEFA